MDVAELRAEMADLLEPIGVLRVYAYAPDSLTGPSAAIYPNDFVYDATYDGGQDPEMIVLLMAPAVSPSASQTQLDGWISTGTTDSAIDALNSDGRFRVTERRNYGAFTMNDQGSRYYSTELVVRILDD